MILQPITPRVVRPLYTYTVALDGAAYRYTLRYLQRSARWYLDLYDAQDNALVLGSKLSIGYPVVWRYPDRKIAGGQLVLLDIDGTGVECALEDLGHRCRLSWVPAASLASYSNPSIRVTAGEL